MAPVMIRRLALPFIIALLGAGTSPANGQMTLGGYAGMEARGFIQHPIHPGQSTETVVSSLMAEPEFQYTWNNRYDRFVFTPFVRKEVSRYDDQRNHWDIRELKWSHFDDGWFFQAGIAKVFWGTVESRRVVDIINQRDMVDNVDPDDKLGQPLVNAGIQRDWGTLQGYIMPYFREGTFPGRRGRLRGPFPVDTDRPVYEHPAGDRHVDVAIRYTLQSDGLDLGIAHFRGTGREPRVELGADAIGRSVLIPHYDIIHQSSLDAQYTVGPWLLKLEAYYRSGNAKPFVAVTGGFEYTFFGVFKSQSDLGLLAEYSYDGRSAKGPPTTIDDELFLGVRWAANDVGDTSLLVGGMVDVKTGSQSYAVKFNRRLTDHLRLTVKGSSFFGVSPPEQVLYAARRDHNILLGLAYFF